LLDRSRELLGADNQSPQGDYARTKSEEQDQPSSPNRTSTSLGTPPSHQGLRNDGSRRNEGEQLNLDDAENPLQLLARTSELLSSISAQVPGATPNPFASRSTHPGLETPIDPGNDIQKFFGRFQPRLDIGEELDPIELGLISLAEAEALFS
jgi:hypothetical protein